jgi:hypothetical protein
VIRRCAIILLGVATVAAQASGMAAPMGEAVATIRDACKYDISENKDVRYSSISADGTSGASRKYTAKFELRVRGKALSGSMTFICPTQASSPGGAATTEAKGGSEKPAIEPALTPKALIEGEDAGGRYARTVAWQRRLPSTRWTADVAYVNSLFGDGQRSPMNYFLVCDRAIARPCVEVEMDQQVALSKAQQEVVLGFLGQIAPALVNPGVSRR